MARYTGRGVSCQKEEVYNAIANVDQGLFPGSFCKIIPDYLTGDPNYCIAMHADGAGTKSSIAYIYWKETCDKSVFEGIAQDALVMNIDDLLCVGACDRFLISSTISRNARQITGEVIQTLIEANEKLSKWFTEFGVEVVTTGGETADVGDVVRSLIVDSTVISRVPRDTIITNMAMQPGDFIYGLASSGHCSYETKYNSGIGSNGLTMAKHELLHPIYGDKYPESCDPSLEVPLKYGGPFKLTDPLSGTPLTIGEALLSPTRTYLPILKMLVEKSEQRKLVSGMVHCSGGGQTKCLRFGRGLHYVKDSLFECPPLFKLIKERSNSSWRDMYQVFNMGHRLEIYGAPSLQPILEDICQRFGVECKTVGRIERSEQPLGSNELTIHVPAACCCSAVVSNNEYEASSEKAIIDMVHYK